MSVGAIQPPASLYREDQSFAWWVYALVLSVAAINVPWAFGGTVDAPDQTWVEQMAWVAIRSSAAVVPILFLFGLGRLTTVVSPAEARVWFGLIPTYRRIIPTASIAAVEVVEYSPIRHCGGWGIRRGRGGELVLNARGNQGVRLHLADGSRILIGSQRPEALALAIRQAIDPGV